MKPLPIAEWLRALDRMDDALAEARFELDRREAAVAGLLVEPEPAQPLHAATALLEKLDDRLAEHERRLATAEDASAEFDTWLTGQQARVGRWQDAFSRWRERIEQPVSGPRGEAVSTS